MNYKVNPTLTQENLKGFSDVNVDRLYNNSFVDEGIVLKLIKEGTNSKGACFNYALKNYSLVYLEDVFDYLDNYRQIDISEIKKGDIIIYFDGDLLFYDKGRGIEKLTEHNIQHLGIIQKANNNLYNIDEIIIRSKWGQDGIFETNINTLPDIYGDRVCFYRRKDKF